MYRHPATEADQMSYEIATIPPVPVSVQMARDGVQLMTQEQRVAFAIEVVSSITSSHCSQHLIRLSKHAQNIIDEIAGSALVAQMFGRA
jgi:hypothetical protein